MSKKPLGKIFAWGVFLWFIGYLLGIIFFMFVPYDLIGWAIMPIGIVVTLWVLFKKIKVNGLKNYLWVSAIWTVTAVIFDYLFLVQLLKPQDGYYKTDVYIYYLITFLLPLIFGLFYRRSNSH